MIENVKLNKVEDVVEVVHGDAGVVIEKYHGVADRILMPLPHLCYEYLPKAIQALKPRGGFIHVYDFVENVRRRSEAISNAKDKYSMRLSELGLQDKFKIINARVVRSAGPKKYQVVLDIEIKKC